MTDEEKKCECKCCKKVKEFLFISGAVFVGAFLAIMLSSAVLKPKMPPCPMRMMPPVIVQPMYQPPMMQEQWKQKHHKFKKYHKNFKGEKWKKDLIMI